eukprot:11344242-Ditylum_brightwellii.AAC.1
MDDQNEFYNNDDSQEESVMSTAHEDTDNEMNHTEKAICDFSKDAIAHIVNEVTPQKEAITEQINKEINDMCATLLKDVTTEGEHEYIKDAQGNDLTQIVEEEGETSNKCEEDNNAEQRKTTKYDVEADKKDTHSTSEMQDDGAFSDDNCNNDNGSLNTQLIDNQNDFDDDGNDSQEDSVTSTTHEDKMMKQIFQKRPHASFQKMP